MTGYEMSMQSFHPAGPDREPCEDDGNPGHGNKAEKTRTDCL